MLSAACGAKLKAPHQSLFLDSPPVPTLLLSAQIPATHKHPFIQTAGRGRPGQDPVCLLGPPHKHKAAKGETRRDDNYLHGSRCLRVSLESGAPSAMKEKCRGLELGPPAWHTVLMAVAPGCPFLPAVQSRRVAEGNQDIVMATRTLGEGTTWISDFSEGNLVLFPAQLLACREQLSWKCPPHIKFCLLRHSKQQRKDSEEAAHHHETQA